ncbi:heterokaryon incompatibility protein-domain-containing protein [Boeremia exigua]|uniref:heterokaryon incompatibility protein-domain-containing protein n=1 Tax=Boeremia exigua TaxID=749465 RepID=UPI001E8DFE65|nr:heterokaryon incompatibility protein-domain-containing protein [Boeremia exigua]KAH6622036.1 heterokaryon incompatibility protein-domain-containing protein [Boeremia exigua]
MPPMMDSRIYTPLSTDSDTLDIRLLRLEPSSDRNATIKCSLFAYSLVDLRGRPHLYEALSYVWGDPDEVVSIEVSGFEVSVTKNLCAALRQIRDHYFDRVLWIDALCIDQGNKPEVARQILSMTQIYSQASRVLVWLGEAADDTEDAFQEILGIRNDEYIGAVKRMVERPWFGRVWVLQEVAAARQIRVLCGEQEFDSYAFYEGLNRLSRDRGIGHPSLHLLRQATFRSSSTSSQKTAPFVNKYCLGELLDLYHEYGATKRHDKVYALLGMSADVKTVALIPDYSTSWDHLLRQVIQYLLGKSVHVESWQNRDIAMISGQCCIIGRVTSVFGSFGGEERNPVNVFEIQDGKNAGWSFPPSAKPPRVGDLLCIFKDAQKATLLRPCSEHLLVIVIGIGLDSRQNSRQETYVPRRSAEKTYHLTVLWDWETSRQELSDIVQDRTNTGGEFNRLEAADLRIQCSRILGISSILCDVGQYVEAFERLRVITSDQKLMLRLDDVQVDELQQALLIIHVLESTPHPKAGSVWSALKTVGGNLEDPKNWNSIKTAVNGLHLKQYELTEEKLVETADNPFPEVTLFLLKARPELFRYPEAIFLTLVTHALNRPQLPAMLEQLLIREHESETQNLKRVLELTAGVQGNASILLRIILLNRHPEVPDTMLALDDLLGNLFRSGQMYLSFLSEEKDDDLHATNKAQSTPCSSSALKQLLHLLDEQPIPITENVIKLALLNGRARIVDLLLNHFGEQIKITEPFLEGVSRIGTINRSIIRVLRDREAIEPDLADRYL